MLDEQKAFIESIRADERKKLSKQLDVFSRAALSIVEGIGKLRPAGERATIEEALIRADGAMKAARKPRTAKLDEGLVALICRFISSELDYTKEEIGRYSGVAGRQLGNYLVALEKQNKIVKTGKGKAAIYKLAPIEGEGAAAS